MFCVYIQEEIWQKIKVEVNVFISKKKKKKKKVHYAFQTPLISYPFFHDILAVLTLRWDERKLFLDNYEMLYPKINTSIKWKNEMDKKKQNSSRNNR